MCHFIHYEAFIGEYPEWARIAQQKLKESLVIPDSQEWCWKFYGDNRGYSKCTC